MDRKYLAKRENSANCLLTADIIETILRENGLALKVNNLSIYQTAFVHRSYMRGNITESHNENCVPLQEKCNETYEYLGDTILNSIIGTYLYDRYYDQNEGFLTKTRTKMVRGTTLGELAKRLNFGKWILISDHVESEGGRENIRILEDLFEAFIAAIYLDNGSEPLTADWLNAISSLPKLIEEHEDLEKRNSRWTVADKNAYIKLSGKIRQYTSILCTASSNGYLYCQKFVRTVYEKYIDIVKLIAHDDNYKDQLQHYFQKIGDTFPKWDIIKKEGKTNNRWHTIGVRDRYGYLIGVGCDKKKTDAEQYASKNALIHLGVIDKDHGVNYLKM